MLDRARENRSQLVFTTARGREAVFWQSPRTRKQARPNVRVPTARAAGIAVLEIVVDSMGAEKLIRACDLGIARGGPSDDVLKMNVFKLWDKVSEPFKSIIRVDPIRY